MSYLLQILFFFRHYFFQIPKCPVQKIRPLHTKRNICGTSMGEVSNSSIFSVIERHHGEIVFPLIRKTCSVVTFDNRTLHTPRSETVVQ